MPLLNKKTTNNMKRPPDTYDKTDKSLLQKYFIPNYKAAVPFYEMSLTSNTVHKNM